MSTQTPIVKEKVQEKKAPLWLVSLAVTLPTFFAFLATSATNVALPHIAGSFGSTNDEAKWVITSYMVANAIFLPLTGWLERKLGRLSFLKIFISLFTIGSAICIMAPDLNTLILGRIIQGIGGGVLMPLTQSILLQEFPKNRKGDAMAIFIFAIMVSSIMGPTVGGFLVDNFSWQWIFIINIPVGIFSLILIPMVVEDTQHQRKKEKVDFVGLTALTTWLLTMQVVLDEGQQFGWFDCTWICWLSGFSLFCMLFFVIWELETDEPIVNLRVFKNLNFSIGTALAALLNVMVFVTLILLPQYFQGIMGYTAFLTGLTIGSRVVACVMLLFIGRLCQLYDLRLLIAFGFFTVGVSIWMCTSINLCVAPTTLVLSNLLFGIGSVLALVPISGLALGTLEKDEVANAAGVHSLIKCVAGSVFTSLASSFAIRLSQVHQTYLVKNMSVYNPNFVHKFSALKGFFLHYGSSYIAMRKSNIILYKQMLVQSKLCSFVDLFQIFAAVTFLIIPLAFLLKLNKTKTA